MAFLSSFVTTLIEAIVLAAVAFGGIMLGKHLRKKKDSKDASQEEHQ